MEHLNWLEVLGNPETWQNNDSLNEVFTKAIEIYMGKLKGLRN